MRVSHRGEEANCLFPWPGAVTVSSTSLFVSGGGGGTFSSLLVWLFFLQAILLALCHKDVSIL